MIEGLADNADYTSTPIGEIRVLAPFEAAPVLAHVVNYFEHGAEANVKAPEMPFFFYKPPSSVSNPCDPIIAHRISNDSITKLNSR